MAAAMKSLDAQPGFRRRFRITPSAGQVCTAVEDDYHCMRVTLYHDGVRTTDIEAVMERAPWTTCPGAQQKLVETFAGKPLSSFASNDDKTANCTHLYDLAQLAAVHALDSEASEYDILVTDPVDGQRRAEIRLQGTPLLQWTEAGFHIVEPEAIAGTRLDKLGHWINTLTPELQEAARMLRWGNMIANGRSIPLQQQSDATRMPPNCFTFQPERAIEAKRVGEIIDFSDGNREPLAHRM